MKTVFDWAAAICAFAAAGFWYKSASNVPDPPAGAFAEQVMPALASYREAAQSAARANRRAAFLSGMSALFLGLGLVWPC